MSKDPLWEAVNRLADVTHGASDADLEQPWSWRAHDEGVRFALLGSYHELRELAVSLAHERAKSGPAMTAAQRALAQYHAAYRDLQVVLLGVTAEAYEQVPAPGEWPLRYVVGHMVGAQRDFFALVHYGLLRQREDPSRPNRMPEDETERIVGSYASFREIVDQQSLADMMGFYASLHQRALDEFATITGEELMGPSVWWEDQEYSLEYRIHRFDAHLRQHTIQAEKTLAAIGQPPNEAKRLLRLVFNALAETESALIGAADLGAARCAELSKAITTRAEEVADRMTLARQMATAVQSGSIEEVQALLAKAPALVNAVGQNRLPVILLAAYNRNQRLIDTLVEAGASLWIFEAAAIGRMDIVQREVERWPGFVNELNIDGFTPLQLACFFNQEEIALWLLEHGADVNIVAQNRQRLSAIHATAAGGNLTILKALLERGADANARQVNDFTALHTAADNGDVAMARLLLGFGADVSAVTNDGRTPLALAQAKGHQDVSPLLS